MAELVEIDAAELATLKRSKDLLGKLYGDKEIGSVVRRGLKRADPTLNIPEDVADEVSAPINAKIKEIEESNKTLRERLEAKESADKDRDALADIHARINAVASKRKLTDDGKAGMIKLMQERQIADPEAAALLYLDTLPKAQPRRASTMLPGGLNLMQVNDKDDKTDAEAQAFWENPEHAADNVVREILNEFVDEAA